MQDSSLIERPFEAIVTGRGITVGGGADGVGVLGVPALFRLVAHVEERGLEHHQLGIDILQGIPVLAVVMVGKELAVALHGLFPCRVGRNQQPKQAVLRVDLPVTVEESATQYSNILFLNSTGKFIMENLKEEISMDELVYRVCQHYEGDVGAIKSEVHKFICKLTELNLLS